MTFIHSFSLTKGMTPRRACEQLLNEELNPAFIVHYARGREVDTGDCTHPFVLPSSSQSDGINKSIETFINYVYLNKL